VNGHELTLSAATPRHRVVRLIGTCSCLAWHEDLTVPAGLARDADRHVRSSWAQHAATPAVTVAPHWLAGDPR
jgi:hypothetical protein